jgi:hypothetical protein
MTKIRKSKWLVFKGFGHWILEFEIYLYFGAWNLYIYTQNLKIERFISHLGLGTMPFSTE